MRRAREHPQRVSVHGKDAVVVVSAETYDRGLATKRCGLDALMAASPLSEVEFGQPGIPMPVREVPQ